MVGTFQDGLGVFLAQDVLEGRPIRVRFTWHPDPQGHPLWAQAFSGDDGHTWETDWTMEFQRRGA